MLVLFLQGKRVPPCGISPLAITGYHAREEIQEHLLLSFLLPPATVPIRSKALCNTLRPLQQNSLESFLANFRLPVKAKEVTVSCHKFNVLFLLLVCTVLAGNTFSQQSCDFKYEHIPDFVHFTTEFDTAPVITYINIPSSSLE